MNDADRPTRPVPPGAPVPSVGDAPTVSPASLGDAATVTSGAGAPTVSTTPVAPPGFVIERELGRGGMGVVYLARQTGLNRPVALKMILGAERAERKHLIRFLAEAEAVASVRHDNVVEVYQYGEHAGQPFMALEFCPGGSLADGLKDGSLEPELAAETLAAVAEGVAAAHALGIVHRDLKPHNVLVASDGSPKVTDFGLAKRAAGESELTKTNAVMGTPAYMAPEQAQGGTKFVGPQADVWALGVMLYELVSGERPFGGDDTWSVLAAVMKAEVVPVRKRVPGVPHDLALICHKCLQHDPRDRYPSAAELAQDLRHFLAGEPVSVRPPGPLELAVKWAKRNRVVAGAMTAVALALVAGTAVSSWQADRARTEAKRASDEATRAHDAEGAAERERDAARSEKKLADEARSAAEKQLDRAERLLYANNITSAAGAWDAANAGGALQNLTTARWDFRRWEFAHLWTRFHHGQVTLAGHENDVMAVAFSPDGTRIASASLDMTVRVFDAATGAALLTRKAERKDGFSTTSHSAWCVAYSPDGTRLAAGSKDAVHLWDAATGKDVLTPGTNQGVSGMIHGVAYSPDGSRVAAVVEGPPRVTVRDVVTGKEVAVLKGHGDTIRGVAYSPDGTRLVTAGHGPYDPTVRIWDAATGGQLLVLRGHTARVNAVAFSPDGSRVASSSDDRTVRVWDAATGAAVATLKGHTAYVRGVAYSPDGTRIATAGDDEVVRLWDAATGEQVGVLKGHGGRVHAVAFSPDGRRIATGGADATVKVWDATTVSETPALTGYRGQVTAVAFDRESTSVYAVGGGDGKAKAWDLKTRAPKPDFDGRSFPIAASADGTRTATTGAAVTLRDAATGRVLSTLPPQRDQMTSLAFSADGSRLVTGGRDDVFSDTKENSVRVWDVATGKQLWADNHRTPVLAVAYHPGGRWVASGDQLGLVAVRDADTGQQVWQKDEGAVASLAYSPDGTLLASATWDKVVTVWNAADGARVLTLRHGGRVNAVCFSPDGSRLASGGEDRTVRVWDVATGRPLLTLTGHTDNVTSVAFSRDGRWLASGSWDGTVRLWDGRFVPGEHNLGEHTSTVWWASRSADGKRLYTHDNAGKTIVWDTQTWQPVAGEEAPIPNEIQSPKETEAGRFRVRIEGERVIVRDPARYDEWRAEQTRRLAAWAAPNPAWHRERADERERAGDAFAAAFHLRVLLRLAPTDAALAARLAALDRLAPLPRTR